MKKLVSSVLFIALLFSLISVLPLNAYAATAINGVSVTVTAPAAGSDTEKSPPQVSVGDGDYSLFTAGWLYGPDIYMSGEPYFEFTAGETYYMLVTLKANDGYEFTKSGRLATGIDEGYDYFDGCRVTGGDLIFSASRTFDSAYYNGDYLRLIIAVTAKSAAIERIGSVSVVFTPPAIGAKADETDAFSCITLPDGADYSLKEADWWFKFSDDFFMPLSGTFEEGETYYIGLNIAANDGFAFNQGGPYGYTSITVTGGTPLYDTLAVTNSMSSDGTIRSEGTVMIAFTLRNGLPGDANGDGRVDMRDVLLMRKHMLNIQKVTEANFANADMNGNAQIDARDLLAVRKIFLNIK